MDWPAKTNDKIPMKKYLLLLLLFFAFPVHPEQVNVDLQRVKLVDLVQLVYGQIIQRSYLVDTPLVNDTEELTVNFLKLPPAALDRETRQILTRHGFAIDDKSNLLRIYKAEKTTSPDSTYLVYRPLHRPVRYLMDSVTSFFPVGSFAGQRRMANLPLQSVTGATSPENLTPTLNTPPADTGINATLDRDPDVIVFQGKPDDVTKLTNLLTQLDQPSGEILVKAVVYEVNTNKGESSAVDLAASILSGRFGIKLAQGAADSASKVFGSLTSSLVGLDVSSVYAALDNDDRFKLLTSPRLRVRSGNAARFSVGSEVPVLGAVTLDNTGRPIQSVSYKPSGVIFDLKPYVRGQSIDLEVGQEISTFIKTTNGVNGSPTLIKRQLTTDITTHDNELIILGGLDETRDTSTDSGFSFLPSWLRSKSNKIEKTEILLMLHVQRL